MRPTTAHPSLPATGLPRRSLLLAACAMAGATGTARAAGYPERAVRIIVPSAPGSSTDLTSRILAEGLRSELGQPMIVDNKGGASGGIGCETLARAAPDGYTIGLLTVGMLAINQSLYKNLRYDPERDFTPIAFGGYTPSLLVVQASSPYRTVADLVAEARRNPTKITFGSSGNGTTGHIAGEFIKNVARVEMQHVPFKSGTNLTAVLAGTVDYTFYHPIAVAPYLADGRLRALAVSSAVRMPSLPQVPTMIEQGFPRFDMTAWYALMGPRGMADGLRQQLATATQRAFALPETARQMAAQGVEIQHLGDAQLRAFLADEAAKWKKLVKVSNAELG